MIPTCLFYLKLYRIVLLIDEYTVYIGYFKTCYATYEGDPPFFSSSEMFPAEYSGKNYFSFKNNFQ